MKESFWKNKSVLVTGGTSGLGKALAEQLALLGARTAIVARHPVAVYDNAKARLKTRKQSDHATSYFIAGDVSEKKEINKIYAQALSHLGKIDVLINNASSLGTTPLKLLADTECEEMQAVLETNLLGPFRLTKLVISQMILARSGFVINISSDAAITPYPRWGSYAISKAALDHLTRVFQAELGPYGLKFYSVDPGDMDTPLHALAIPDADRSTLRKPDIVASALLEKIARQDFELGRRGVL